MHGGFSLNGQSGIGDQSGPRSGYSLRTDHACSLADTLHVYRLSRLTVRLTVRISSAGKLIFSPLLGTETW